MWAAKKKLPTLRRMASRAGTTSHNWTVTALQTVPEYALTATLRVHRTGAQHLHIDRNDTNNVFLIGFKTNPPDATGVPHILEHTTLCGSAKYPVRDPFFKMLNRLLLLFMNAMTAHDHTFYPFATTNQTDYANLRLVYLLLVLEPLLRDTDFYQEGWRLEHEVPSDASTPLQLKGVVYNEMKGQMQNSSYLFYIRFLNTVYPSLNNLGGDPAAMTALRYSQLVDFHQEHYHPSNAYVYTYGDMPVEDTLQELDQEFGGYGKRGRLGVVKNPIVLDRDVSVVEAGPIDTTAAPDRQHKSLVTFFAGTPEDPYRLLCLQLLGSVLVDGHSLPFYQQLVESGMGSEFSVNTGLDTTTNLVSFTVGLQGMDEAACRALPGKVEAILKEVREKLAADPKAYDERVNALLHQLELRRRDHRAEFGMGLLYSVLPQWVNGRDPIAGLRFQEHVDRFREEYASGSLFPRLLDEYFVGAPKLVFTMEPSAEYDAELAQQEQQRLESHVAELDDVDREAILARGTLLEQQQLAEEDLSSLPTLTLRDIPRSGVHYPMDRSAVEDRELWTRVAPTNGLSYIRQALLLGGVRPDLHPFLPLFAEALTLVGTARDMATVDQDIQLHTGGILALVSCRALPRNTNEASLELFLGSSALHANAPHVFRLWRELLTETDFGNVAKLETLIRGMGLNAAAALAELGHSYARSTAAAALTPAKALGDVLGGVGQVQFVQRLVQWANEGRLAEEVVPRLEEIRTQVLAGLSRARYQVISEGSSVGGVEAELQRYLAGGWASGECQDAFGPWVAGFAPSLRRLVVDLPFQVSYASLCVPGVAYTHQDGAALQVLATLLTYKHLHTEIREKGGAYGAGALYGGVDGVFGYYTYRDPQPQRSLDIFAGCGAFVEQAVESWGLQELQEAKLLIFQGVDAPVSVRTEGAAEFGQGITQSMRQQRREAMLAVGLAEVKDAAARYLVGSGSQAVVGSAALFPEWDKVVVGVE